MFYKKSKNRQCQGVQFYSIWRHKFWKFFRAVGANHSGAFVGLMCVSVCLKKMLDTLLLGYSSVSLILEIRVNLPADSNFQHHEKKVVPQFVTKKRQTSLIEKRKFEICAMWKNQSVFSLGFWWEKVRATLRNLKFCYKLMYCHTITLLIRNLTLFCVSFFGCRFYMDGAAIYV